MRVASIAVVLALAVGCAPVEVASGEDHPSFAHQGIVGGQRDDGDPAVVALVDYTDALRVYCTGSLVGRKTVLTAGHCIEPFGVGRSYRVVMGPVSSSAKAQIMGRQVAHPSFSIGGIDVGVIELPVAPTGVTPLPLSSAMVTSADIGRMVRHVGYGARQAGGELDGFKYQVTYPVRSIQGYWFESGGDGQQTCTGDSGGPALMVEGGTEYVAGVVSKGDVGCADAGFDARIDLARDWLTATMSTWDQPNCEVDGLCRSGCIPEDQDCVCAADGQCAADCTDPALDPDCPAACASEGTCSMSPCARPDPDCVAIGSTCGSTARCLYRLCVSDGQHQEPYCSSPCLSDANCPGKLVCTDGQCQFAQLPVKALAERCYFGNEVCEEGVCAGPVGLLSRCVLPCATVDDCPNQESCEAGQRGQFYCRPSALSFEPQAFGCAMASGSAWAALAVLGLLNWRKRLARPLLKLRIGADASD
jgi:V8-like Glu-specific endopeptidase